MRRDSGPSRLRVCVRLIDCRQIDGRRQGKPVLRDEARALLKVHHALPDADAATLLATAIIAGTVLDDDPRLDVRLVETAKQPLRVVIDSRLETPPTAKLLAPPGGGGGGGCCVVQ